MDLKAGLSNLSNQDVSLLNVQGEGSAVAFQDKAIEGLVPAVKNLIQSYPQLAGFFDPPVSQDDAIAILNSPHVAGLLAIETGATASAITLENIVRHVEYASVGGQFNTEVFESTLPQLKVRSELGQESDPAQQKLISTMSDFAGQIASAQVTLDQAVQQLLVAVDDSPFLQSVLANDDPMSLHVSTPQKSQSLSQALSGLDLPISSSSPNGFSDSEVSLGSLSATFKSLMGSIAQFSSSLNNSINTGNVSQRSSNVANPVESKSIRSTDLPSNAPQVDAEDQPAPPRQQPAQTRTEPGAVQQNNAPTEKTTPASATAPSSETAQPSGPQQITANVEKIQKLDIAFTSRTEELSNAEMREAKKLIKETIQMLKAHSAAGNASVLTPEQQTAFADSIVSLNSKIGGPDIAVRGSTTGEITVLVTDPVGTAAETVIAKGKLKDFVPPDDVITSPNTESLAKLTTDKERPVLSRTVSATAIGANANLVGANSVGTRSAELDGVGGTADAEELVGSDEGDWDEQTVGSDEGEWDEQTVGSDDGDWDEVTVGSEEDIELDEESDLSETKLNELKEMLFSEDPSYGFKEILNKVAEIKNENPNGNINLDAEFVEGLLDKFYYHTTYDQKRQVSSVGYDLFKDLFVDAGMDVPDEISDLVDLFNRQKGGESISPAAFRAALERVPSSFETIGLSGFDSALQQTLEASSSEQVKMLSDLFEMMGQFTHEQALLMTTEQKIQVANLAVEHAVYIPYSALLVLRGSSSFYDMPLDSFPRDIQDAIKEKANSGSELLISEIEKNDLLEKWAQGNTLTSLELKEVIATLINISATAYGVSSPPELMMVEDEGNGEGYSAYGSFDPETNFMEITPASDINNSLESLKLAELIFHEMSHAWQYQMVKDLTSLSQSFDLSESSPENQLALLLKNSFDSIQDPSHEAEKLPYYTGWEEKTSYFSGQETLIALLEYSNKHFQTNYSWNFVPVKETTQDIGAAPGFETNSGGWEIEVSSTNQPNPSAPSAPLQIPPASNSAADGELSEVRMLLGSTDPTAPAFAADVADLLERVARLNHTQAAILSADEKIQIINFAREAGLALPDEVNAVLGGSASNFDLPLDSLPPDIVDLIDSRNEQAQGDLITAINTDPLLSRWASGQSLAPEEQLQVLNKLSQVASGSFGVSPPPKVSFYSPSELSALPNSATLEGAYDPSTHEIKLNPSMLSSDKIGGLALAQVVFHEMSHAWQHQLVGSLPPGQALDLSEATSEERLGLLLSASFSERGQQSTFGYLGGWEEKVSFAMGNSAFQSVVNYSNQNFGTSYQLDYVPRRDESESQSAEKPGYQSDAGGMVLGVADQPIDPPQNDQDLREATAAQQGFDLTQMSVQGVHDYVAENRNNPEAMKELQVELANAEGFLSDELKTLTLAFDLALLPADQAVDRFSQMSEELTPAELAQVLNALPTAQAAAIYNQAAISNPSLAVSIETGLNSSEQFANLKQVLSIYTGGYLEVAHQANIQGIEVDEYINQGTGERVLVVRGPAVTKETTLAALANYDPIGNANVYFGQLPSDQTNLVKIQTIGEGNVASYSGQTTVTSLFPQSSESIEDSGQPDSSRPLREQASYWQAVAKQTGVGSDGLASLSPFGNNFSGQSGQPNGQSTSGSSSWGNAQMVGGVDNQAGMSAIDFNQETGTLTFDSAQEGIGVSIPRYMDGDKLLLAGGTTTTVNESGVAVEAEWQAWAGVATQGEGTISFDPNQGITVVVFSSTLAGGQVWGETQLSFNDVNVMSLMGNASFGLGTEIYSNIKLGKDGFAAEWGATVQFGASVSGDVIFGGQGLNAGATGGATAGGLGVGGGLNVSVQDGYLTWDIDFNFAAGAGLEFSVFGGLDVQSAWQGWQAAHKNLLNGNMFENKRRDSAVLDENALSISTGDGRDKVSIGQLVTESSEEGYSQVTPLVYSVDGGRSFWGDNDTLTLPGEAAHWDSQVNPDGSTTYTHRLFKTNVVVRQIEHIRFDPLAPAGQADLVTARLEYEENARVVQKDQAFIDQNQKGLSSVIRQLESESGANIFARYFSMDFGHFVNEVLSDGEGWESGEADFLQSDEGGDKFPTPDGYPSFRDTLRSYYHEFAGRKNGTLHADQYGEFVSFLKGKLAVWGSVERLDGTFFTMLNDPSIASLDSMPSWAEFSQMPLVDQFMTEKGWTEATKNRLQQAFDVAKLEFGEDMSPAEFVEFISTVLRNQRGVMGIQSQVSPNSSGNDNLYIAELKQRSQASKVASDAVSPTAPLSSDQSAVDEGYEEAIFNVNGQQFKQVDGRYSIFDNGTWHDFDFGFVSHTEVNFAGIGVSEAGLVYRITDDQSMQVFVAGSLVTLDNMSEEDLDAAYYQAMVSEELQVAMYGQVSPLNGKIGLNA